MVGRAWSFDPRIEEFVVSKEFSHFAAKDSNPGTVQPWHRFKEARTKRSRAVRAEQSCTASAWFCNCAEVNKWLSSAKIEHETGGWNCRTIITLYIYICMLSFPWAVVGSRENKTFFGQASEILQHSITKHLLQSYVKVAVAQYLSPSSEFNRIHVE